jgi:tripartite-type tricarboxylate transporter receptor subunit TctC
MIKRLFTTAMLAMSLTALAVEKITIIWGFSAASNQANFYRAMVTELNRTQNKYEFVFDVKPGAGGAVGARYVLEHPTNTVLGGSSTFFIRPNFDKETGYATESFQPVLVQALGSPVALYSSKFKSINDLKLTQDITTAIAGHGSHSNLMASILSEHFDKTRIINYVSLVDATKDVVGKHVDTGWNWLSDIEGSVDAKSITVLGITGLRSVRGLPTLSGQGIKGFENVSTNTVIVASKEMPTEKVHDLYELMRVANRSFEVTAGYDREHSNPADLTWPQTVSWYDQQVRFWREQSAKVKPLQ